MFLLWVIRLFAFRLLESPRFLIGQGKDKEAVEVLNQMAAFNGTVCRLTVDDLRFATDLAIEKHGGKESRKHDVHDGGVISAAQTSWMHVKQLFSTRKMAISTSLLVAQWSTLFNGCSMKFELSIPSTRSHRTGINIVSFQRLPYILSYSAHILLLSGTTAFFRFCS